MAEQGQRGFEDLECYQLALQVFREAYRIGKQLPLEEKYNLSDQLRRAAGSAVLNIAEGYGRYHYLDSLRFYYIARGSMSEILSTFILCHEAGYLSVELSRQRELCYCAMRALNGYIRYVRSQKQGNQEYGDRVVHDDGPSYVLNLLPEEE